MSDVLTALPPAAAAAAVAAAAGRGTAGGSVAEVDRLCADECAGGEAGGDGDGDGSVACAAGGNMAVAAATRLDRGSVADAASDQAGTLNGADDATDVDELVVRVAGPAAG